MVKVKVCGTTSLEDGLKAAELGADFIGFVTEVENAERSIDREQAKEIFGKLKGKKPLVVLTALGKAGEIAELAGFVKADAVQVLAKMPEKEMAELRRLLPGKKIFKTIHVSGLGSLGEMKELENYVDFFVLDSGKSGKLGGTGKKADWGLCSKLVGKSPKPVFLAGGLNPENVAKAVKEVKPFGVDASSGIKKEGNKREMDLDKVKAFVEGAKNG